MPASEPHRLDELDPRSADFARKLSAFLVDREVLDELGASRGLRAQRDAGERFDLVLVRLGLVTELAMAQRLAEFCGMPFVSSAAFPTSTAVGDDVNAAYLKQARRVTWG